MSQAKNDLDHFEQREHAKAEKNADGAAYVGQQVNQCYLGHLSNFCITLGWIKHAYGRFFLFESFISLFVSEIGLFSSLEFLSRRIRRRGDLNVIGDFCTLQGTLFTTFALIFPNKEPFYLYDTVVLVNSQTRLDVVFGKLFLDLFCINK